MKKQLKSIVFALLVYSAVATAQNRNIKFEHGTWQEVKDKAAKENKLVFIDCYTSWCGPCKWIAKTIFTNDTVADYFNEHFICAKFDMEVGEGKELAKKYAVQAYPSLIFADTKGEMVHRNCGAGNAQELIAFAKDAQTPDKTYSSMIAKYNSGNRDASFILNYLKTTQAAYLNTNDIAVAYLSAQKESDLSNRANWNIIRDYLADVYSPTFKYLIFNKAVFIQNYTEDSVLMKIADVYGQSCMQIIYSPNGDKKKYDELKEEIKKSGLKHPDKLIGQTDLAYYQSKGDWVNYAKTAVPFIDTYCLKEAGAINNVCYTFYENVTDKAMIAKALEWSKIMMGIVGDSPMEMDTYACLLYKSGKKQEAVKTEEKAVQLIKTDTEKYAGVDVKDFEGKIADWKK